MKRSKRYGSRVNQLSKRLLGEAAEGVDAGSYEEFFQSALEKFGVSSPAELDDDKKDDFFNYVDANWDAGENETDIDEAEEPLPDSPGMEDVEDNMIDEPDPESAVREMIRKEIRVALTESIRDDDIAAAQEIGPDVVKIFDMLEKVDQRIEKELSEFNSPGFRVAIKNAIKTGIGVGGGKTFDKAKALKVLTAYLKRG